MTAISDSVSSLAQYSDFYHTGSGTPAGAWFRTFWHPIYRSIDLPAGRAKPVRLMSEDFTLYRGEGGDVHAVAFRCAHRGTQLSTGWVEGDEIRCFYHGWKYDSSGQCIEQPAEPEPSCQRIRIKSCPVQEYLGLIFVYLGEGEPPPLQRYPDFEIPGASNVTVRYFPYNVVNNLDGHPDHAHLPFVHGFGGRKWRETGEYGLHEVRVHEDEFGIATPEGTSQLGMPNVIIRLKQRGGDGDIWGEDVLQWRVPVDDEHHASFYIGFRPGLVGERAREHFERLGPTFTDAYEQGLAYAEAILRGEMRIEDVEATESPSCIVIAQDGVSQMGMGVIPDRSIEHLGAEDAGLIMKRNIWTREIRALAEGRPTKQWYRHERLQRENLFDLPDPAAHG